VITLQRASISTVDHSREGFVPLTYVCQCPDEKVWTLDSEKLGFRVFTQNLMSLVTE